MIKSKIISFVAVFSNSGTVTFGRALIGRLLSKLPHLGSPFALALNAAQKRKRLILCMLPAASTAYEHCIH